MTSLFMKRLAIHCFMFSGGLFPFFMLGILFFFQGYPHYLESSLVTIIEPETFGTVLFVIALNASLFPFMGWRKATSMCNVLGCGIYLFLFAQYFATFGFTEFCVMLLFCGTLTTLTATGTMQWMIRDLTLYAVSKSGSRGAQSLR